MKNTFSRWGVLLSLLALAPASAFAFGKARTQTIYKLPTVSTQFGIGIHYGFWLECAAPIHGGKGLLSIHRAPLTPDAVSIPLWPVASNVDCADQMGGPIVADEANLYTRSFDGTEVWKVSKLMGTLTVLAHTKRVSHDGLDLPNTITSIAINDDTVFWTERGRSTSAGIENNDTRLASVSKEGGTLRTLAHSQNSEAEYTSVLVDADKAYWLLTQSQSSIIQRTALAPDFANITDLPIVENVVVGISNFAGAGLYQPLLAVSGDALYWSTYDAIWTLSSGGAHSVRAVDEKNRVTALTLAPTSKGVALYWLEDRQDDGVRLQQATLKTDGSLDKVKKLADRKQIAARLVAEHGHVYFSSEKGLEVTK